MNKIIIILSLIALPLSPLVAQGPSWSLEINGGAPYSFPSQLNIEQEGYGRISLNAKYRSEPFTLPLFWDLKISKAYHERDWSLELIHHKLFLDSPPDEIDYFSITHGYNILMINRGWIFELLRGNPSILSVGAGTVIAHPENKVRGKELNQSEGLFNSGYYLSGLVLGLSASHRIYVFRFFYLNAAARFYPSYASVPIAEGRAFMWNFPVALNLGFGIDAGRIN